MTNVHVEKYPTEIEKDIAMAYDKDPDESDGDIHDARCFIVTTHSPNRNWTGTTKAFTCAFCIRDFGS